MLKLTISIALGIIFGNIGYMFVNNWLMSNKKVSKVYNKITEKAMDNLMDIC